MRLKDLNFLEKERRPFLFITDFKAKNIEIFFLDELEKNDIEFEIDENYIKKTHNHTLLKEPLSFEIYEKKFNKVIDKIKSGDSYLLNLTQETEIKTSLSLKEIYNSANAHYKLRYKDKFVCFSPEKFIQISENKIDTYPMKGTIDASIEDAKEKILADTKEMAEHIMVVDLLRNDLSIVAKDVKVEDFRYITTVDTGEKKLLQVSSHISGTLEDGWQNNIGDILSSLLPAGSITGTPKKSTVMLIEEIEKYERGYFTGVFGVYDGENLDSGVMIRFIEKTQDGYIYKSGGGITLDSDVHSEYNELLDKIYLP
ncbi:MAG: aminodeoxychorismate synthase component I [Campylobacterota bacterium]|nr:aminodeoxychorismate synthase component I [Campylobacterota bacterium]